MTVVVPVLAERRAVLGDRCRHELPHDAGEVRGHQHRLKAWYASTVQLHIYEAKEVYELVHRGRELLDGEPAWQFRALVEVLQPDMLKLTSSQLKVVYPTSVMPIRITSERWHGLDWDKTRPAPAQSPRERGCLPRWWGDQPQALSRSLGLPAEIYHAAS
jgi:hypothetical protein